MNWFPVSAPAAPFTPPSITGLVAWYDASNAGSITASGSPAHVSQWNDLSGNGYHLTQATGARQPTTGVGTINGLNRLDFDGGDILDRVTTPSTSTPVTVAYVAGIVSLPAFYRVYDGGSAGNRPLSYANASDTNWVIQVSTAADTGHAIAAGNFLWVHTFNGAASTFHENGTQYGGALAAGTGAFAGLTIGGDSGASAPFTGAVTEFIVYDSALGATDRGNLTTYLHDKWGFTF